MGSNELSSFNCSSSCKCVHGSGRRREGGEGPFFHFSPFQLYFFVKCYNRHIMGGVDLLNQAINCYRIRVRIRKWYWKIFTWMIDLACTNVYFLSSMRKKTTSLEFRRSVVMSLLSKNTYLHKSASLREERHIIKRHETPRRLRCQVCSPHTIYFCSSCDVSLHPDCFSKYH